MRKKRFFRSAGRAADALNIAFSLAAAVQLVLYMWLGLAFVGPRGLAIFMILWLGAAFASLALGPPIFRSRHYDRPVAPRHRFAQAQRPHLRLVR